MGARLRGPALVAAALPLFLLACVDSVTDTKAQLPHALAVQLAEALQVAPSLFTTPTGDHVTPHSSPKRSLQGPGFHRLLQLEILLPERRPTSSCELAIVQYLPSSLFADPYQLEGVARSKPELSYELLGPLDLEL